MTEIKSDTTIRLSQWWQGPLGQCVLMQERALFQSTLRHFHGYCQLQIGVSENLLPDMANPKMQTVMAEQADLSGSSLALPFKCCSLDTVVMAHVLEFSNDPHQTLREAERVLMGDGTLIIASFNPWSLWGARRLFSRKDKIPWQGHFFSQSRIKDWLSLLNFDVIETQRVMFRPPLVSEKWLMRTFKLESYGLRFWPIFSGVSVLIATKRTIPLTPVAQRWRATQFFPKGRIVTKPATREKIDG